MEETAKFTATDLDKILAASAPGRNYSEALALIAAYLTAAAECIDPRHEIVVDPQSLLIRFEEVLLITFRMLREVAPDYATRLGEIDDKLNLSQNVVMLGSIALAERPPAPPALVRALSNVLRMTGEKTLALSLPDQEPQPLSFKGLLDIKTALNRMAGLVKATITAAKEWYDHSEEEIVVEGIYEPHRIRRDHVRTVLAELKNTIEASPDIPQHAKAKLLRQLFYATLEVDRATPPWSKIMSRLVNITMVLAATVTVIGGLDDASENLQAAYQASSALVETIRNQASGIWVHPPPTIQALPRGRASQEKSESDFEVED